MRLHEPFFAAASEPGGSTTGGAISHMANGQPRLAAGPHPPLEPLIELFDERSIFGIVWFDTQLTTTARFGDLSHFVEIGVPLSQAVLPMYGLDDQIEALRRLPDRCVEVQNVATHTAQGSTPKLNFVVYWTPKQQTYVMLISRVMSRSDLELELSTQTRARTIAEAKLLEKSREIERANRDLAEFAYVISHDLKAPMRALRYTTEDLSAALGQHPDAEASKLIEQIREQTTRMSDMLLGLLTYSRIGRKREAVEAIDTRQLAETVARGTHPRPGFSVVVDGEWPTVPTLAAPLDLVLRNLIDNALKHHDRREGTVRVTAAHTREDYLTITIADDGPGIPPEYHAAVFQPFVKLNARESAPVSDSSGIGLSLVRKTVETVGGTLLLSSVAPAMRGTTVKIEWPIIEPDVLLESVVHDESGGAGTLRSSRP